MTKFDSFGSLTLSCYGLLHFSSNGSVAFHNGAAYFIRAMWSTHDRLLLFLMQLAHHTATWPSQPFLSMIHQVTKLVLLVLLTLNSYGFLHLSSSGSFGSPPENNRNALHYSSLLYSPAAIMCIEGNKAINSDYRPVNGFPVSLLDIEVNVAGGWRA